MSSDVSSLRNIAFVGHSSAGKTTLVDALAFALGASDRKGSVADKTSICDTEPEEQERGHTFQAKLVHATKGGARWNLIDTPGYPDFVADAISAMFATEMTVGVVSCASGVTYNLRQKLETAKSLGRGRAIVITHVDGENADFDALVDDLRRSIGEVCVPINVPDKNGHGFSAVKPAPEDEWKKALFDRVMDACEDEEALMRYLETEELSPEELKGHLPRAIAKGTLVPILVANPQSGIGIEETITFLREFGLDPTYGSFTAGGKPIPCEASGPLLGVVYNVKSDPHVGKICLARIVRGTLKASDQLGIGRGEKLGGLFHPVGGKSRVNAESIAAGDLAAFSKVEGIGWAQSFSVVGAEAPAVAVPKPPMPMVALAVQPKSRNDEQKIGQALAKLVMEDPTLKLDHNATTHELVVNGMSDLHLQVMEMRLKRRYGVEITTSLPRIAYKETVTKASEGHHRHKKQSGGRGQFGECYLRIKPAPKDAGVVFVDGVVGGAIPRNLIPAVEKGVVEVAAQGILTHSQVVDVEVEVYDGKFHAVDSDEASFKKAGATAFRDGFMKAGPVLLEPVMSVEIRIPTEHAGAIFSDLTSHRRGTVLSQESEADGTLTVIQANAPLATMQTYHRDLKSQTAGEGTYAMRLDHYARVPGAEQEKIISQLGKRHVEED